MGDFYVTNASGYVIRGGYCPDGMEHMQAMNGETAHIGKPGPTMRRESGPVIEYTELRRHAYPPLEDLADALIKTYSEDSVVREKGEAELTEYAHRCLDVKASIPKTMTVNRPHEHNSYLDGE